MTETAETVYRRELRSFLDADGLLQKMPAKHKKRLYVYQYAATMFEAGRTYTEGQVNAAIGALLSFDDPLHIRRALVDYGFMARKPDGSAYWKTDKQPTAEDLGLA